MRWRNHNDEIFIFIQIDVTNKRRNCIQSMRFFPIFESSFWPHFDSWIDHSKVSSFHSKSFKTFSRVNTIQTQRDSTRLDSICCYPKIYLNVGTAIFIYLFLFDSLLPFFFVFGRLLLLSERHHCGCRRRRWQHDFVFHFSAETETHIHTQKHMCVYRTDGNNSNDISHCTLSDLLKSKDKKTCCAHDVDLNVGAHRCVGCNCCEGATFVITNFQMLSSVFFRRQRQQHRHLIVHKSVLMHFSCNSQPNLFVPDSFISSIRFANRSPFTIASVWANHR